MPAYVRSLINITADVNRSSSTRSRWHANQDDLFVTQHFNGRILHSAYWIADFLAIPEHIVERLEETRGIGYSGDNRACIRLYRAKEYPPALRVSKRTQRWPNILRHAVPGGLELHFEIFTAIQTLSQRLQQRGGISHYYRAPYTQLARAVPRSCSSRWSHRSPARAERACEDSGRYACPRHETARSPV